MVTFKQIVDWKLALGTLESLRQFRQAYDNKWKRDYPDLYKNRYMKYRLASMYRRGGPRRRRRRLMASRKRQRTGYRSKKAVYRPSQVGQRVGSGTAKIKQFLIDWDTLSKSTRTLYTKELTDIDFTSAGAINKRDRYLINLRGFKINFDIDNVSNVPFYVNMALISPRNGTTVDDIDFFRNDGESDARYRNFGTALSSVQLHYMSINRDKYTVLKHKRWNINGGGTNNRGCGGNTWRTWSRYVKMNRQIQYDQASGTTCLHPVFLVYWFDVHGAPQNTIAATNTCSYAIMVKTYFREPKN